MLAVVPERASQGEGARNITVCSFPHTRLKKENSMGRHRNYHTISVVKRIETECAHHRVNGVYEREFSYFEDSGGYFSANIYHELISRIVNITFTLGKYSISSLIKIRHSSPYNLGI